MDFKKNYLTWSETQLQNFYENLESISRKRETDLTKKSLQLILEELRGDFKSLLDVGCSKGSLLTKIKRLYPALKLTGVDFIATASDPEIIYVQANINRLPFNDKSFDVVICSHTLEHIYHLDQFISELKRVTRKKLIVVTPKQRYYYYSLDEHLQFFPRKELLTMKLGLNNFSCNNVEGDWFYVGYL